MDTADLFHIEFFYLKGSSVHSHMRSVEENLVHLSSKAWELLLIIIGRYVPHIGTT